MRACAIGGRLAVAARRVAASTPVTCVARRALVLPSGFTVPDDDAGLEKDKYPEMLEAAKDSPLSEFVANESWRRTPRFYTRLAHAFHSEGIVLWHRLEMLESATELATATVAFGAKRLDNELLGSYLAHRLSSKVDSLSATELATASVALVRVGAPAASPVWAAMGKRAKAVDADLTEPQRRRISSVLSWANVE
ncbi:hypothetical protein FNF27_06739 [Cafeteria roenbergensis]|uniref:Uncharacterized protein n=1 Tax=Cafeteria roenbergensis TaxID=33653 RepID=A0A5A8CMS2_CAFRO|nr:hypothetical protein FNF28_06854 [Cafeteria roenbergensis]KAA0154302.1 hypothetical protein FNF29_02522 [Cafeteria roenbergensis]KAA0155526.1 hypothetical protein FNF31_06065 [Cafeteria roenbergensis]KAA0170147.1 hypothetical protein FNF27_06739 [Cafeteria roenbergensis]|eukprot:KAA0154302.1 hypothetical protein FNF29_02522 [Cafeteria roenbergensis]